MSIVLDFDVMVKARGAVVQGIRPENFVVPSSAFHGLSATTCPNRVVGKHLWTVGEHQVSIFLEVGNISGPEACIVVPCVHHLPAKVHQVNVGLVVGVKEGVAVVDGIRGVRHRANGVLGQCYLGKAQRGQKRNVFHKRGV